LGITDTLFLMQTSPMQDIFLCGRIKENHFHSDLATRIRPEIEQIETLNKLIGDNRHIVFNANLTYAGYIPVMFYTIPIAYDYIPTEEQFEYALKSKKPLVIIDKGDLPEYIQKSKGIRVIDIDEL
jgi:hypothetical protein